ncbi:MAG TPA: hypothetical protein VLB29_04100 [Nocardioidaceae bacterium]|nr:hypothetical protein [Nocardioidaceae bacterium]
MHRKKRTFAELLTRSLATAGLVYALVIAYAVPATLMADATGRDPVVPGPSSSSQFLEHPTWRPADAARFPGCVDMARWTAAIVPSSVIVVRRSGELERMPFDEAFRRATSPSAADDLRTIGACRR